MKENEPQYLVRIVASIHDNKFNCFHIRASLLASNCGRRFRRPFPIKSSAFHRNRRISIVVLHGNATVSTEELEQPQ